MRIIPGMKSKLRTLLTGEAAQDLVEYGLAVSLIALALISGMNTLATAIANAFTNISTTVTPTAPPSGGQDNGLLYPGPLYRSPAFVQAASGGFVATLEPASHDRGSAAAQG